MTQWVLVVLLALMGGCDRERRVNFTAEMLGPPMPKAQQPTECDAAVKALTAQLPPRRGDVAAHA